VGLNAWSLYEEALSASDVAYDRSLLASAKTISEQLDVEGYDELATIRALVPYAATEAFEADNQSRLYYKVSHLNGAVVSGFADMPTWKGQIPAKPAYAALVDFYNDRYQNEDDASGHFAAAGGERQRSCHGGHPSGRNPGTPAVFGTRIVGRDLVAPSIVCWPSLLWWWWAWCKGPLSLFANLSEHLENQI
jgi:hypothetical protein